MHGTIYSINYKHNLWNPTARATCIQVGIICRIAVSDNTATGIVGCPHVAVDIKTADYKLLIVFGEGSLLPRFDIRSKLSYKRGLRWQLVNLVVRPRMVEIV